MNKPVSIAIKEFRENIVQALANSQLPACILEPVLGAVYQQVAQAAEQEVAKAEQQISGQEVTDNGVHVE